jgi:preprotein translocase subunit YajC
MAQQAGGGGGAIMQLAPLILIFGVFWLLVIRPQSKKAKQHSQMLQELKKGEDVVTQGGIIGRITGIKDTELTLQVQEGVRLRVLRSAITGRFTVGAEAPKADVKAS